MSIFADAWRECLREQYKHVIRTGNATTRRTLTEVMNEVGFGEDELAQLRLEATMRAEDVPDDFVPDMNILNEPATQQPQSDFQPHPLECQCPQCVEMNMTPHDEDGQPIQADDEDDPEAPKQLGLF
jgi:hypothetical protein